MGRGSSVGFTWYKDKVHIGKKNRSCRCLEMIPLAAVTQSWDHRMVEVGREHWRSSTPTSLLKQGPLEHAAQDCIPVGVEYLQ